MTTTKKTAAISAEMLNELLDGQDPATVLSSGGLLGELKKALAERMLNAEMDVHLGSEAERQAGNHHNGSSPKTVLSEDGEVVLSIPRDRHGRFDPALIAKYVQLKLFSPVFMLGISAWSWFVELDCSPTNVGETESVSIRLKTHGVVSIAVPLTPKKKA